jgi:hypothetical protein
LLLKYHPGVLPEWKTPQQLQTFILLAVVNYLEQKRSTPTIEKQDILNANVSPAEKQR